MEPPISVVATRGGVVESRHAVHAVAVRDGEIVRAAGDPSFVTFMRSTAKPFQALALAVDEPDIPERELAIACASHDATEEQLAAVRALLARAGATEEELECGERAGSRLRHPCSGKHAGMLLRSRRHGWPLPGYRLAGHPVQEESGRAVAEAAGVAPDDLLTGVDGCGVVSFALPLASMAHAFSWLVAGASGGSVRVVEAMRAHPVLVGGPTASDTALMRALEGAIAKRGTEGLLCVALEDGTGVAVKAADGANRAALPAAAAFLGIHDLEEEPVRNSRNEEVGRIVVQA